MADTEINYDKVSFVISSSYRETVILALNDKPQTPSEMSADDDDPGIAHVSRALNRMREKGLVELLVSEDRKKGRLYGLTSEGEKVAKHIKNRNNA